MIVLFLAALFYNSLMPRWISKLVLVFFIGWLPMQTFAMVVNPPCEHNQQAKLTSRSDAHALAHPHHAHHPDDGSSKQSDSSCDKCALCAICSFTALVSLAPVETESSAPSFIGTEPSAFSTIYLDHPRRPPRISRL